jgi:hypothetical protein
MAPVGGYTWATRAVKTQLGLLIKIPPQAFDRACVAVRSKAPVVGVQVVKKSVVKKA